MAAPIAYEQPTLNKTWEAFVAHIPTLLVIWVVTAVLTALGYGAEKLFTFVGNGGSLEGLDSAADTNLYALFWGQLGQFPFSVLSSLVGVLFAAVPAMYYSTGEIVAVDAAFRALLKRPWRYLLAGILFTVAAIVGTLFCVLPGVAILLITPVYVNKIFTTEMSIFDAFSSSFQAVYRSEHGWTFVGIQILAVLVVIVVSVCTCGLGILVAPPMASFYVQNAAYRQGVLT